MILGYTMDLILGISLAAAVLLTQNGPLRSLIPSRPLTSDMELQTSGSSPRSTPTEVLSVQQPNGSTRRKYETTVIAGFKEYADAALFLAVSIQIAAVVVLVRKDFGINANGLGGITVEITWTVSLLTMLPMVLLISLSSIRLDRPHLRFFLVCICWALFMYTFISRMIATYGPSQIGTGGAAVISPHDWAIVEGLCLQGVKLLTRTEATVLNAFGIGGSIFLSLIILGKFFFCLPNQDPNTKGTRERSLIFKIFHSKNISSLFIFGVFVFGVPQIWAIIRLRDSQQSMARTILQDFVDNQWTFGQVVAVVVFSSVFVELLYSHFQQVAASV
jgi:hypothetical protein